MSQFIYQFDEVVVKIDGNTQGLVQNVSVKADTGLDFVTFYNTGIQGVYRKANNINIDVVQLHNGTFVNPTGCLLYNNIGHIIIERSGGTNIDFSGCVLIGTKSNIDADSGLGSKTLTYMALGYTNVGSTFTQPSPATGKVEATRACYTGALENNQTSFESSCTINRELLYSPGRANPTHICIQYPITTTSTVTKIEDSSSTVKGSGTLGTCAADMVVSATAGIDDAYLENIAIEGATVKGDVQKVSYSYRSTKDYGLNRIITLIG
jgi:hypothetical protein